VRAAEAAFATRRASVMRSLDSAESVTGPPRRATAVTSEMERSSPVRTSGSIA
jgi:hypothetical protein